jgi:hypothetical protein
MENIMVLQAQHYVMKDIKWPLLWHNSHNQTSLQYTPQINLPNDPLDEIIAYCSNKDRGNLRKTCKQLAYVTSINRLNALMMHDFKIGNRREADNFFKAIIKSNNPELIPVIINFAQKKSASYRPLRQRDAVCINFESNNEYKKQEFIKNNYIFPLLKEAIAQNNNAMINKLQNEGYGSEIMNMVKNKNKSQPHIKGIIAAVGTGIFGMLVFTTYILTASPHAFYNATNYPTTPPTLNFI